MIRFEYIFITILLFVVTNIMIWFQLNSQLVWKWAEGYKSMLWMSLLGIPISILFWYATKIGYLGFGNLWALRFIGFAASMITFPFMTYYFLGEPMTLKVWVTMGLAIIIMIIQLI